MSMQQIIEMLAKAVAKQEDMLKRMDKMDYNQEKMAADRIADKEESREANLELTTKLNEEGKAFIEWMDAKTKATQAETKAILAETKARREKRMEANTNDDRKESTACQDVMEARLEYEEPASGDIKDDQNETTACNEATEKIELDPGMMQSAEEHQVVRS
jgi:hypothetical protein